MSEIKTVQSGDEIDLFVVLSLFIKGVFANKLKIFISISGCLLISYIYYLTRVPVFKTEMVLSSQVVTGERLGIIIEPLGELAKEQNYAELSRLTALSPAMAKNIVNIEAKELKDESRVNSSDNFGAEVLRQQNCLLTLKLKKSSSISDSIAFGILYYLRHNAYINRLSSVEKNSLNQRRIELLSGIEELEKLKNQGLVGGKSYAMIDIPKIDKSLLDINFEIKAIDRSLELNENGINIIKDFTKYKNAIEPSFRLCMLMGFIMGIFISLIAIFSGSINKLLKS